MSEKVNNEDIPMITKKSWEEFQSTGLLLIINQILHIFGWVMVIEYDPQKKTILNVYPARTKFRGFSTDSVVRAYQKLSDYMLENAKLLHDEAYDED